MLQLFPLGFKSFAHHKFLLTLTAAGVTLGVAVVLAVGTAGASVDRATRRTIAGTFGDVDVYAMRTSVHPNAEADDRLQRLGSVRSASEQLVLDVVVRDSGLREPSMSLYGVDPKAEVRIGRRLVLDRGHFPKTDDEVMVPSRLAADANLGLGGQLNMVAGRYRLTLRVSGILAESGLARGSGGRLLITSLGAVRKVSSSMPVRQVLLVALHANESPAAFIERMEPTMPEYRFVNARAFVYDFLRQLDPAVEAFLLIGLCVLFGGVVLVFHMFALQMRRRARSFAVMQTMGLSVGGTVCLVLVEAACVGLFSSGLGLGAGVLLARITLRRVGGDWGFQSAPVHVPIKIVLLAAGLGLASTVGAAAIPAIRAATTRSAEALRGSPPVRALSGLLWVPAVGSLALSLWLYRMSAESLSRSLATVFLALMSLVLIAPTVVRFWSALSRRMLASLRGRAAFLSTSRSVHDVRRSAALVGFAAVVYVVVLSVASIQHAGQVYTHEVVDRFFGADLRVLDQGAGLDAGFTRSVASAEGVDGVSPIWTIAAGVKPLDRPGVHLPILVVNPSTFFNVQYLQLQPPATLGDARRYLDLDVVLVEGRLARRWGLELHDQVIVGTKSGPRLFPIVAIYESERTVPRVMLGYRAAEKYFQIKDPIGLLVDVNVDDKAPDEVAADLHRTLDTSHSFYTETSSSRDELIDNQLGDYGRAGVAVLAIVCVAGFLALANSMTLSVVDRRREFATLAAIGASRGQVVSSLFAEGLTTVVLGLVLAIPAAVLVSRVAVGIVVHSSGLPLEAALPLSALPLSLCAGGVAATAASLIPLLSLRRVEVAELRSD